jgi:hypothetical protein
MPKLITQAELIKLSQLMDVPLEQVHFLSHMPPEAINHFRLALMERMLDQKRSTIQRLAIWVYWMPVWASAMAARLWLSPSLVAKLASNLPAWRIHKIAQRFPADFMARVAKHLDPRVARELVQLIDVGQLVEISKVLLRERDYVTMGRFVGMLSDEAIQQVSAVIKDETELLEIAFHVESTERMDHLVHVLPEERVHRALMLICDPTKRLIWPKLLALMSSVGYDLKRKLGDLAVKQGEQVINALIYATQQDDLWEDMLPVVACLSPNSQKFVVNLPVLREPLIMQRIILAADQCDLWADMLTVANYMHDEAREAVAQAIALSVEGHVLEHIAYATLLRSQWPVTLDVVRRLPIAQQNQCYDILKRYFETLDHETYCYLQSLLIAHGIGNPADARC